MLFAFPSRVCCTVISLQLICSATQGRGRMPLHLSRLSGFAGELTNETGEVSPAPCNDGKHRTHFVSLHVQVSCTAVNSTVRPHPPHPRLHHRRSGCPNMSSCLVSVACTVTPAAGSQVRQHCRKLGHVFLSGSRATMPDLDIGRDTCQVRTGTFVCRSLASWVVRIGFQCCIPRLSTEVCISCIGNGHHQLPHRHDL